MASQFENRLVGISILVATVVIFLPTIIDGKKMVYEDEFVATPIHPELKEHSKQFALESDAPDHSAQSTNDDQQWQDTNVIEENDDQWQVEEVLSSVDIEKQYNAESVATTDSKIVDVQPSVEKIVQSRAQKVLAQRDATKKIVPQSAWTIQLGAFQNASNINSLLKTLHKAGFQAHTIPSQVIDGELTRLFVGPDVSKTKLEKQLPRLKRLTKLEGKLYPFDAVNP